MRVAVVTLNPRVYYMVTKVLKEHGIGFYSLLPGEEIPPTVEVVVTDCETDVTFPQIVRAEDEDFILELNALLSGNRRYESLIIGIDPGERPGLCVVGNGTVVEVARLKSPKDITPIIEILRKYPKAVLKVGRGGGHFRTLLLRELMKRLGPEFPVFLVNEHGTTPKLNNVEGGVKDIVAAINIAFREGEMFKLGEVAFKRKPTRKEIENIKRRSRELSGNVTISTHLAREVALGRITIEEAISIQRGGQNAIRKG